MAPFGSVFGVQLGLRQTQALFKTKSIKWGKVPPAILLLCRKHYYFVVKLQHSSNITGGTFPHLIDLVLNSACVCRRPSWTPKTQPGGGPAPTWLSFWCSTRLLMPEKSAARTGSCRTVSNDFFGAENGKNYYVTGAKISMKNLDFGYQKYFFGR